MTDQAVAQSPSALDRLKLFVESSTVQRVIVALILINAVTLGLETSETAMAAAGGLLVAIDKAILAVFVVELLTKLAVYRLGFFRSGWNVFDFVIVAIALIPASGPLSVLRALRILRVLRLLSVVPSMRRVVQALLDSLPGMGSVAGVLVLVMYVTAVLTTKLFGDTHPEYFGTIGGSVYTLFQIMTLESWSHGIVRPVMEVHAYAWAVFVPFILLTTFAVLNLVVGIVVNSMQALHEADKQQAVDEAEAGMRAEISAMRAEIGELKALLLKRDEAQRHA